MAEPTKPISRFPVPAPETLPADIREVVDHYGDTIVRGAYDGEYDKINLPAGDLILSNYFSVRDGKIVSLIVIRNTSAAY